MPKFLNDTGLSHLVSKIKTLINGKITEVHTENLDIKMLGWSTPVHMGIKNTITASGLFQQNVGRIKIKMHTWNTTAAGIFYASLNERSFGSGNFNVTSNNYPTHTVSHSSASNIVSLVAQYGDGIYVNAGSNTIFIADSRYSTNTQFLAAVGNDYLYCELATKPAAINIDGNEATLPQGVDDASGLNLTSSYGTFSGIHFVRIGRFVCVSFAITLSAAVSVGTVFINGLPKPSTAIIPLRMYDSSGGVAVDGYINSSGQIGTRTALTASHGIYINAVYISSVDY